MKQIFKIIILLAIFNLAGCCKDCDNIPRHFDTTGFSVRVAKIVTNLADSTVRFEPLDSGAKVNFDKLNILLQPSLSFYGKNTELNNFDFGNLFTNAAYACKCSNQPGYLGSVEKISEIKIFSSYKFNNTGTTADNLSSYFDIEGGADNFNYFKRTDLDSFTNSKPFALRYIQFFLKAKPTGSLIHKFTIKYKHTDGETFIVTTPTIEFNQ